MSFGPAEAFTPEQFAELYDINGLRLITLDSTVPGHHHGEVTDAQLAWLADVLARIAASDYQGWIGCEYAPVAGTEAGLSWTERISA